MKIIEAENSDTAVKDVLNDIFGRGNDVSAGPGKSVGANQTSAEILAHQFVVKDPGDRLIHNDSLRFSLPIAIARFIWLIGGNDRLHDIQFYTEKVARFTDDGIIMPGSCYGRRMRYPRPGLDQIKACIEELRNEPASRRAALSIFFPEDSARKSNDIPCAFGMFFHTRNGQLLMTNVMRSNNAFLLLPYNLFEFSLVGEIIAAALSLKCGAMTYFTGSMHLYAKDRDFAKKAIATPDKEIRFRMPSMPRDKEMLEPELREKRMLEQLALLARKEAQLREGVAGLNYISDVENLCEQVSKSEKLHPDEPEVALADYFKQLYYILVLWVISDKSRLYGAHWAVKARLDKSYRGYLGDSLDIKPDQELLGIGPLLNSDNTEEVVDINSPAFIQFSHAIPQAEAILGKKISVPEFLRLARGLRGELLAYAARRKRDPKLVFDLQKIVDFLSK